MNKKIWSVLKWILCLVVILFVGKRAFELWESSPDQEFSLYYGWLILSGIVYLLGWFPSVWFYRMLLERAGGKVNWKDSARSYYCGHLGKYIPGKALVLVIRAALVSHSGIAGRVAGLMAAYETLVMMGAGAALSVALFPFYLNEELLEYLPGNVQEILVHPKFQNIFKSAVGIPAIVLVVTILLLPFIAKLFSFAAAKMAGSVKAGNGKEENNDQSNIQIGVRFLFVGLLSFILSWFMMGLSLGLILKGVGLEQWNWEDLPMWTGIVSLATVIGFVAIFAPGGVGVREGILIGMLSTQPMIGEKSAIAAAFLLRVVWLLAEVSIAGILYYGVNPQKKLDES